MPEDGNISQMKVGKAITGITTIVPVTKMAGKVVMLTNNPWQILLAAGTVLRLQQMGQAKVSGLTINRATTKTIENASMMTNSSFL
jgi:hypothetical protein